LRHALRRGFTFSRTSATLVWNCRAFADHLLNEAGVATLAGTSFGKFGDGYLRLSYANSVENLQKALARIDGAVRQLT